MRARSVATSSWPAALVTGMAAMALLLTSGSTAAEVLAFAAYVLVLVTFPGVLAWRLLLRRLHTSTDRAPTWLEDTVLGTAFGFGLQLPVYLLGVAGGVPRIALLVPPAAAVVVSVLPVGRRIWRLPTSRVAAGPAWVTAAATVYAVFFLARRVFPLRPMWLPADKAPFVDETFHQALIAELRHHAPPELPTILGTHLDYHWFVHAQYAAAQWMTGVDPVVMLRQLGPVLFMLLAVPGVAAVTHRLCGRASTAAVASVLLVAGGYHLFGAYYDTSSFIEPFLSERFVASPSQAYGYVMVLPVLYLTFEVLRPGERATRWAWVTLLYTLFALAGAKATFLPIFLVAALATWIFQLVRRRRIDGPASGFLAMVAGATAFAQVVLYGGGDGGLFLQPLTTARSLAVSLNIAQPVSLADGDVVTGSQLGQISTGVAVLALVAMLIAWLLPGSGAVGLLRARTWTDSRAVFLVVAVLVGVSAGVLLFRPGLANLWFARSVSELVVVLSGWGLAILLPRPLPRVRGLQLVGVAAVAGALVFLAGEVLRHRHVHALALTPLIPLTVVVVSLLAWWVLRRRHPGSGRKVAAVAVAALLGLGSASTFNFALAQVAPQDRSAHVWRPLFAPGGEEAARYVRDHSGPDAVVATNMHCARGTSPCDNRHFWVSAYTERRVVLEGWGYSAQTNDEYRPGEGDTRFAPSPDPERQAINDAAFAEPSEETVSRLIDTYGVDWLLVRNDHTADVPGLDALPSLIKRVYSNGNYVVYKVVKD